MIRILTLTLAFISLNAWAFDFKGIHVGKPATSKQVLEKLGAECGTGGGNLKYVCNGSVTIAREPAKINLVIGSADIVQRINLSLSPESFDHVAPALIGKFGKPTSTKRSELQNRMGAKFNQVTHTWLKKDGRMVSYQKYAGSLDHSTLNFSTKEDRDFLEKLYKKNNRSGDL